MHMCVCFHNQSSRNLFVSPLSSLPQQNQIQEINKQLMFLVGID